MKLTNQRIIVLIVALASIAIGLWLYVNVESYEDTSDQGYQLEARRNQFLAAGRLMEQFGAKVVFSPVYAQLPTAGATLVFPVERRTLSQDRSEELLRWVKDGGHLVAVTWTLWREENKEPDFLLDPLGVHQLENEPPESGPNEEKTKVQKQKRKSRELAQIVMPDNEGVLQVRFDNRFRLEDASDQAKWELADDNGVHALRYSLGRGSVTVLTDYWFMSNRWIAEGDHAALIYRLIDPKPGKEVWFIYNDDVPALWKWLVENAWTVVTSSALLLVFWLWAATRRLGPLMPPPARERRSMIEHVTASGRYLWRHKRVATLYQATIEAFMRQVRVRHPQWAAMSAEELAHKVAGLTGLAAEKIAVALNANLPRDEEKFMHDIYIIETLRTKL